MLDISAIRQQFPAFNPVDPKQTPVTYLDSAATAQKPQCVIDAVTNYYQTQNANVHRGSHQLTSQATTQFEAARTTVANFINAKSNKEIIWTRGATESINLIAQTYARNTLTAGDEILVSEMEHHANIVPWQIVAKQTGAKVVKIPMADNCQFDMAAYKALLSDKTKIVAVAQMTNVTGTVLPIDEITKLAHQYQAVIVVDGAQGIVHQPQDKQHTDIDFYVFSGHKIYAPTGIGALYGKQVLLEAMPPWHGGGKMVEKVSFEQTTFAQLPGKFEAGTPNIAGAIGLACAINWYQQFEHSACEKHLQRLQQMTYQALTMLDDIHVIGYQPDSSILTFVMDGVHHQDIATLLDQQGIAVRAGHHCAHPLMDTLKVTGTVRISFAIYNTESDVTQFITALKKAVAIL